MLEQLALAKVIMERYQLSVDEACALWFDMKTYGRGDGDTPQDLWDRVWNTPPLMAKDVSGKQPPYYRPVYAQNPLFTSTPITIKWSDSAEGSLMVQAGLSRALGLGHADLRLLADSLSSHSKQQQEEQGLTLMCPTMSALYRHARLAQALKLPIREFLQLLSLLTDQKMLTRAAAWTVAEVTTICDTAEWLKQAGITVPQLAHLLTGQVQEGARPVLTAQRMEQALERIRAASASVRLNADSFISDSIDAARSQAIHDQLVQDGFIDLQGLVSSTLEINQSAIYTSLITDPERREAIFLANPLRQVAYLQNENPDGTITLPFDPFSDPVIQSTNCFTICLWINSDTNRTMTWPSFITWNQSTDQQTQSPTITQQSGTLGQVAFTYSQQGGSGRTGLWLPNFIERSFEWIHVAWVVKDGAWTIYRNGQEFPGVDMVMNKPPYAQQSGIPDYPVGYGFGNLLTGGVADVGIWNVALTEQEVRSVVQSNPGELSNGLIGYWPVDEGSGTTIHDLSGSSEGQDGVLSGTYKWEAIPYLPGNSLASSVSDILLQALQAQNALAVDGLAAHAGLSTEVMTAVADLTGQCVPLYAFPTFNGDGDYMQVPYAANLNGSNISIGMFIKPTGSPDTERILISSLDQSNPAATKGYQVSLNAQNQVVFTIGTGGSSYCTMTSPRSIKANVWTSIVALAGGGQMSLYLNFLDGEVLYGQPAYVPNATEMLYLGAGLDSSEVIGGFFEGHITLVAISDTLSNNNAFLLNYKKLLQGQTPDLPNLTAFWKLNDPQPSSVTVPDASGNGNEGTLENAKQSSVSITYTPYPVNELLNLLPRNNPQRFPYLLQLAVNTQMAKLLRLTATEVNSITEQASALGTTGIGYAQPLLSLRQLQTLTELKAMTRAWGDATNQTLEYLRLANSNNPDAGQVNGLLALITGWTATDISTLWAF
ncbi:MAG: LamG-like jellyroll fold domain-containing protein [Bacteroidia bacterium]